MQSLIIADKYSIGKLIGKGSFGEIYEGYSDYLESTQIPKRRWRLKW